MKWALLAAAVSLHLGMMLALRIPYANAALLAACVLYFREELVSLVAPTATLTASRSRPLPRLGLSGAFSLAFVGLLTAAMLGETNVREWRSPSRPTPALDGATAALVPGGRQSAPLAEDAEDGGHNVLYAPLWALGIAQSYRLFDWVDHRNWDIRYEVVVSLDGRSRGEAAEKLFPASTRHVLLQSNIHGVRWAPVERARAAELRDSVLSRYARRYCAREHTAGTIEVYTLSRRITLETSEARERGRDLLMRFECRGDEAVILEPDDVKAA